MKTDKSDILSMLRQSRDYVSGEQLCTHFGVSRTAVWKAMNQLKEEGYQIEAVSHKGYRLLESPDVLSANEILSRLSTKWAGKTLYYAPITGSTNIDAKQYAEAGAPHGTTVVANMQTAGKGRRGRRWQSPQGNSIYMSILLKPDFAPDKASMLTLVMALSVAEAITETSGLTSGIKWPNDIVVNQKKVCGILTELNTESDYIQYVVIGVGINVNNASPQEFPEEIRQTATSLKIESGSQILRAVLLERVLAHFEKNYDTFVTTLDLTHLKEAYEKRLLNLDAEVKVLDPQGEFTGIARGIDKSGELIIEKEDGQIVGVYAGEVSIRGLYGYI
ncbi:MAG: biotin--[acetyl-CoA-carboxylase] ligase [Roseburia sp.]|nr:biotin--[acetyl-CoA-carboxylase] ligase [Ruminococcus sp.]MCM1154716.1 biotin--[acetyl-CoA-carboxylase] ligase [Roseburia sp.]MCM1242994.1 biotin--[acetyl-CoA-carboxylase] ligase [Roseburia sp.]